MGTLQKKWDEYRKDNLSKIELLHDGYAKNLMNTIKVALCFWNFIHEELFPVDNEDKIAFLKENVKNKNVYIGVISMVELLPERIWRKILWRYNIDYSTPENFLRRLTESDIINIKDNYDDIYEFNREARILKARFFDRLLLSITKLIITIGLGGLLPKQDNESLDIGKKHLAKSAWTKNFALLDIGFGLYSKKIDDTQRTGNNFKNFFSLKSHENDFAVNKDDGIYWFLYRFVRSWFGIDKKRFKKVRLKPWICIGFWQTIALSLWFFIGPVIAMLILYTSTMTYARTISLILSMPFIIWLINKLIEAIGQMKYVGKMLARIAIILIIGIVISLIVTFFGLILGAFLQMENFFNDALANYANYRQLIMTTVFLSFISFVGVIIHNALYNNGNFDENDFSDGIVEKKYAIKSFIIFMVLSLSTLLFIYWIPVTGFLKTASTMIFAFLSKYWLTLWASILPLMLMFSLIETARLSDEAFFRNKKRIWRKTVIYFILSVIPIFILMKKNGGLISNKEISSAIYIVLGIIFLISISLIFSTVKASERITEESLEIDSVLKDFFKENEDIFDDENERSQKRYFNLFKQLIIHNGFINSDNYDDVLKVISKKATHLFPYISDNYEIRFISLALKSINKDNFDRLVQVNKYERINGEVIDSQLGYRSRNIYMFVKNILSGMTTEEALANVLDFLEKEREDEHKLLLKEISLEEKRSQFFAPITKIFSAIGGFFKKIWNVITDFWELIDELYHKSCPYIGEDTNIFDS